MLRESLRGKHSVVVTGTGSGKTEAFLLPLLAGIVREAAATVPWAAARNSGVLWDPHNVPSWTTSRRSLRGEQRPAAMRAMVLYPMNALVEDQLSRLRVALDCDEVREACDLHLRGNRIRFGRFTGGTPVSGHPVLADGKANTRAIKKLRERLLDAIQTSNELVQKLARARQQVVLARESGDPAAIRDAAAERDNAFELLSFVSRVDPDSAEMFHRWEMQSEPPDILITNVSMLSMLLMRHRDPSLGPDRADSDMLDRTREWLSASRDNIFHLVIDELHLYRGAAGTEVAYLIRLLLDRLGLHAGHGQLRVLASSASLEAGSPNSFEFLGGMFGLTPEEARDRFHISAGVRRCVTAKDQTALGADLAAGALSVGKDLLSGALESPALTPKVLELLSRDGMESRLLAGFGQDGPRATAVSQLAERWFADLPSAEVRLLAVRGLCFALGQADRSSIQLPRLRFHWMARNVDGLWAVPALPEGDRDRRVGTLLPEAIVRADGSRVLEVLYCECCGTQFLCGHKVALPAGTINPMPPNPSRIPGLHHATGGTPFELTVTTSQLGALPEGFADQRTDSRTYDELGVVWLTREDEAHREASLKWKQGTEETDDKGRPIASGSASWVPAYVDPASGIVRVGGARRDGAIACLWFHCESPARGIGTLPGMPQLCPSCQIDYSERRGRRSPVRSFVTGLSRMSHLLTKHLFRSLPAGASRRLVAFSDSREGAAALAAGVEVEHWEHLLRASVLKLLMDASDPTRSAASRRLIGAVEAGRLEEAAFVLQEARRDLPAEFWGEMRDYFSAAREIRQYPDFATEAQRRTVEAFKGRDDSHVRLDSLFAWPSIQQGVDLPPIWHAFASLGVTSWWRSSGQQGTSGRV